MRCPNCHADLYGDRCPSCGLRWSVEMIWTCPDCGTWYSTGGNGAMRFCPACVAKKEKLAKQWLDEKTASMRSVAGDIVAQILAGTK